MECGELGALGQRLDTGSAGHHHPAASHGLAAGGLSLTVIGGIFGKNNASSFDAPCRTKNIAREIPPQPWYKSTLIHMTVGGFLPFSAISVELYYIFATVWGREQYTLYGILFLSSPSC